MLLKGYIQHVSKFGKFNSGHRTGKGQCPFQSQRRAMPKKVQTNTQLRSFHVSKVMLELFQTRFQEYVNWDLPDVQARIRKGRGTRDQIANIHWIVEKPRKFQKTIYFCFTDYTKAFVWITTNCGKFLEMGVPDHVTCLLRNLYAGKKATVKMRHGTMFWF